MLAPLLLAPLALLAAPPPPPTPRPRLHAVFLSLSNETVARPERWWAREFGAMAAVGIRGVVIPSTAQGTADGDPDCPGGRFTSQFPVDGSPLRGCFKPASADPPLLRVSRAAQGAGLSLHLGLAYPFTHLWMYTDPVRRSRLAETQQLVARQLHALLGDGAIASVYTELEWSNQLALQQNAASFAGGYLQPIAAAVQSLRGAGAAPFVWASPYGVANMSKWRGSLGVTNRWLSPVEWGHALAAVLDNAPGLSMIAPQDSVGALGNSAQNVSALLGATAAVAARHKRQAWSNVELFQTAPTGCDQRTTKCGRQCVFLAPNATFFFFFFSFFPFFCSDRRGHCLPGPRPLRESALSWRTRRACWAALIVRS